MLPKVSLILAIGISVLIYQTYLTGILLSHSSFIRRFVHHKATTAF